MTWPLKVLAPLIFTSVAVLAVVNLFIDPSSLSNDGMVAAVTAVGMTLFCYWWSGRLKTVGISENSLYVSYWRKEISIPLREVEYIYYFGAGRAAIRLKSKSEFGRTINFLVPLRVLDFNLLPHPVVEELRDMVKSQQLNETFKLRN